MWTITVNVPPVQRARLENWMWKQHKIGIRGTGPSKLPLGTASYVQRGEIDKFLEEFDRYKKDQSAA